MRKGLDVCARLRALLLLLAGFGVLAHLLGGCKPYHAPPFQIGPLDGASGRHFAVIGDTQSTLDVEVWREGNDPERRQLLPKLAGANPSFVVMVGDLVSWGGSTGRWREFDEHSQQLRQRGIPVLAVPGNHDYWGDSELRLYFAHFPEIRGQRWYERRYGPLGMIFLDSNAGPLGPQEWDAQRRWYEATLDRLQADETVRGILVFLHHAPFTNSSIVDDDVNVLRTFVPSFSRKEKTLAMLTGHAHGYERFQREGKSFIVTGGGGGPRGPLRCGDERRHADELFRGPRIRHFNFVELSLESHGLHAYVVGLPKGERTFCRMEEFDLPWPSGVPSPALIPAVRPQHDLPACYRPDVDPCGDSR